MCARHAHFLFDVGSCKILPQAFSLSSSHAMLSFLLQKAGISFKVDNRLPNLVNLNEDPQLSEMLLYMLKEGNVFYSVFGTTRPFLPLLLHCSTGLNTAPHLI